MDQTGEPVLELAHLLGHVEIAEVESGIRQVDHELGGVLRLREHGLQISWSVVHSPVTEIVGAPVVGAVQACCVSPWAMEASAASMPFWCLPAGSKNWASIS